MSRSLRVIAKEINDSPELGLSAAVSSSYSSTDSKVAGTRFRRSGKGSWGLKLIVTLARTGKKVCEVDTSTTYERASDADEWLQKWRDFDRQYHRAPSPHFNDSRVAGEPHASRGRVLTVAKLKSLPDRSLVWLCVKEHGEEYPRIWGTHRFTRKGDDYFFEGFDFALSDTDVPKGHEAKLSWTDDESSFDVCAVKLTPWKPKP